MMKMPPRLTGIRAPKKGRLFRHDGSASGSNIMKVRRLRTRSYNESMTRPPQPPPPSRSFGKPARLLDEARHRLDALAGAQICEHERARAPHPPGVLLHHGEARADMRREVDLVDDEKVGAGDPGTALARDLLAAGDVDDVDRQVGELGREGRGEVVAAG